MILLLGRLGIYLAAFILPTTGLPLTLKMGTLAPEGSAWMEVAKGFKAEVEEATQGKIKIIWYSGGVMGDEKDMVKKMRLGQLHGVGLTGFGLGQINPEIRVLELPLLFNSYKEFEYVIDKLINDFRKTFAKMGYRLLHIIEVGFVYVFSKKPIAGLSDLDGVKLWIWSGDPLADAMAESVGGLASPIRLDITDVLTGLQTGMINTFYNTPYATLALQWYNWIKYITMLPLTVSVGGIVLKESAIKRLSEDERKILMESALKHFKKLSAISKKENEDALKILLERKLVEAVKPDVNSEEFKKLKEKFLELHTKLVGKLYPEQLYKKVITARDEFRAKK